MRKGLCADRVQWRTGTQDQGGPLESRCVVPIRLEGLASHLGVYAKLWEGPTNIFKTLAGK